MRRGVFAEACLLAFHGASRRFLRPHGEQSKRGALHLARPPRFDRTALGPALEDAVTHFLAPPRQHEGVDVECVGDRLNLHPGHAAKLHRRELELDAVAVDLLRAGSAHSTPPSVS